MNALQEMRPTPRDTWLGMLADALAKGKAFGDKAQIPQGVPLVGGQGLGSLLLGQAPEEVNEWSYGNAPIRVNALAGRTAGYMPEVKPGRQQGLLDVAMMAPVPGARNALAVGAGGLLDGGAVNQAIFMGAKSKTWNKEAAEKAAAMERAGADPRAIWQETGTFKGADGKWRQEIDDSAATMYTPKTGWEGFGADIDMAGPARQVVEELRAGKIHAPQAESALRRLIDTEDGPSYVAASRARRELFDFRPSEAATPEFVGNALSHKGLLAAYPDTAGIKYREGAGGVWDDSRGMYSPTNDAINLNVADQAGKKSTLLHELQHAIQERQGFAGGGSPAEFSMLGQTAANPRFVDALTRWNQVLVRSGYPKSKLFQPSDITGNDPQRLRGWLEEQGGWLENQRGKYAPEFDQIWDGGSLLDAPLNLTPEEMYRRLAGEAEARAVQKRMGMNALERRQTFPLDSYDVPINDLIVR